MFLFFNKRHWKNLSQRTIATSSLRRQAQWLFAYRNDHVVPLRGNIQTRIDKIKACNWDGAIFAQAGLDRLSTDPTIYTPDRLDDSGPCTRSYPSDHPSRRNQTSGKY